jgi:thiol-disulfide isomerase/thioredoxin
MNRLALAVFLVVATPAAAAPVQLEARTLDGQQFRLADTGSVTVVNFWASWCVPCRVELPAFDAWYQSHRADKVRLIAISMDTPAQLAKVTRLAAAWHFPVAMADASRIPDDLRPNALPVTLIYDRAGKLRFDSRTKPGPLDTAMLDRLTAPLLKAR